MMKQALLSLFSLDATKNTKFILSAMFALAMCFQTNAQVDCLEVEDLVLACNGNINVALNSDCEAEITLAMILSGTPYDNPNYPNLTIDDFELVITSNGTVIPATDNLTTVLSNSELGADIQASVSIPSCGMTCWGNIVLEDKSEAVLNDCEDVEITCEEFETGNSATIYRPTFDGNCTINMGDLTFEDDTLSIMCSNGYASTIERTWTALDDDDNFLATCTQSIFVQLMDIDDVVFPDDFVYDYTQSDGCEVFTDEYLVPSRTGEPTGLGCPNIKYFYNDTDFELCGVSRKILRNWTVIDWCTGESTIEGQIIKVLDDEPVIKVCPPDTLMFPAIAGTCEAVINLDPFDLDHGIGQIQNALSECSEFEIFVEFLPAVPGTLQPAEDGEYSIEGVVEELNGTYTLPNVPEGLAWVRYRFVDACGNASPITNDVGTDDSGSCYFEVQVKDTLPPTAICEGFTKVSLDQSGFAEVLAETFDDHSYDVCGEVVDFEVKLLAPSACAGFADDTEYGPSVRFCCANLGDTLTVMLKVIDDTGLYSECEAKVCIVGMDDQSFVATCPADVTANCGFDYEGFNYADVVFDDMVDICAAGGTPTVIDTTFDTSGLDLCGIGEVIRTVRIELPNGQTTNCTSSIFLSQGNPLQEDDIRVQAELTVEGCGSQFSGLEPEIIGGFPVVNNNDVCVSLTMNYVDLLLTTGANSNVCHKIKRTWTVIDWCTYEVNNGYSGLYTFEQIIALTDLSDPFFADPCVDVTLNAEFPNCDALFEFDIWAEDNCTPAGDLTYAYEIDVENGPVLTGSGNFISQVLPGGVHQVTVTVYDFCGNTDVCVFDVSVIGSNPPSPICLASVVWVLDDEGNAEVWASDFDLKSEGGCGSTEDLTFSFTNPTTAITTNMMFDCSDIPNGIGANIPLEVFVIDAGGAYESCVVTLVLQDSQGVCIDLDGARAVIEGKIFTETYENIDDVDVELYENMVDFTQSELTTEGDYIFDGVPFYNGYMVKPSKDDVALNGVSTLDLVLIQKHILGTQALDSPYKLIAADVNNSNSISGIDLIEIRKVILGLQNDWSSVTPWVFVPENHVFADEEDPFTFPETTVYNGLFVSQEGVDFIGIKMGDVTGNAVVNASNNVIEKRSADIFRVETKNAEFNGGAVLNVPFTAVNESIIDGLQFTIEFDASVLKYNGYENGVFALNDVNVGTQNADEGIITMSYDDIKGININGGEALFALNFVSRTTGQIENVISINSAITSAEAYDTEGGIQEIILQSSEDVAQGGSFELFQNQPNPFNNSTEIGFFLPEAGEATFEVMSADGKVIFKNSDYYNKGMNRINLDGSSLENKGVLLYRVEYNGFSATRKMIFIN